MSLCTHHPIRRPHSTPSYAQLSMLVLGTEARQVIFLDPTCTKVKLAVNLPSVPTHLAVSGAFAVEFRVHVACRDGVVYTIKDKVLMATRIECDSSLPCGLVRAGGAVYVGSLDSKLHSFSLRGKRNWAIDLPAPISAMERMNVVKCVPPGSCVGRGRGCPV